jgi:hypothetical protein
MEADHNTTLINSRSCERHNRQRNGKSGATVTSRSRITASSPNGTGPSHPPPRSCSEIGQRLDVSAPDKRFAGGAATDPLGIDS